MAPDQPPGDWSGPARPGEWRPPVGPRQPPLGPPQPPPPPPGPPGYSAGGLRPQHSGPVTPEWAKERARQRPAEPPPPPALIPRPAQPPKPPRPPGPAAKAWRRIEFPAVLVLVLGLVAALTALTSRAGTTPDTFPHNDATALWPADGAWADIEYTTGSTTEPGTIEHARLRGFETLAGIPAPWAALTPTPEGDVATAHFWRQTNTRFNELDRRIQLRQATTGGTMLFGHSWDEQGITFWPPVREIPHDIHAGQTWESRGEALAKIGGEIAPGEYTNTSTASDPEDPAEAGRGCLLVTSQTSVDTLTIDEESLWCPGEGIVRQTGSWNGRRWELVPGERAPVSEQVRQADPIPDVTAGDPGEWETGWLYPPMEMDFTFGIERPVVVSSSDPVVGDSGWVSVASHINGDVITLQPARHEGPDYPVGTAMVQWRAHPGGEIAAVGVHGQQFTATTTRRTLSLIGGNGARRWTIELSEVAQSAPISVGPDRLAVATLDGRVRLLDAATGAEIWNTEASQQGIAMPLATDGTTIAAVDANYTLLLVDVATGELLSDDLGFGQPVSDVTVADGIAVVTAGGVNGVDARTGERVWRSVLSVPNTAVISGDRVAVGTPTQLRILDLATGRSLADIPTGPKSIAAVTGGFMVLAGDEVWLLDPDGAQRHTWSLQGTPADILAVGDERVWALGRVDLTGWWVRP